MAFPSDEQILELDEKALPKVNRQSVQGRAETGPFGSDVFPLGGAFPFALQTMASAADDLIGWSPYPMLRDRQLRDLANAEPTMAGAKYSIKSKIKSMEYVITGGRNSKKRWQSVFGEAGFGQGWGVESEKVLDDLINTDNGAFLELVGAGAADRALVGPVTGIAHMDSNRCWRTFDPEYPVVYWEPLLGTFHKMHYTRIISMSNNTSPSEVMRGIGYCPVSRAVRLIQLSRDILQYKHEKVSGRFSRALGYGGPITPKQFRESIRQAALEMDSSNNTIFNNIHFVLSQQDLKFGLLDLASLPDGFNQMDEMTLYVYILALCFGVDAREFWPATTSGATKADATVQHMKAQGKGIADLLQTLERVINWRILSEGVEFHYDFTDDQADYDVALLQQVRISNVLGLRDGGLLTTQQAFSVAVAQGLIDLEQLVEGNENPDIAEGDAPLDTGAENPEAGDQAPPGQEDQQDAQQGQPEQQGAPPPKKKQPHVAVKALHPGRVNGRSTSFTEKEIAELFEEWNDLGIVMEPETD